MTDRAELERRVDELAQELSGRAFAKAVQAYFDELDPESQEELRRILVERAANLDQSVMDRVDARGWFRRQWDKAAPPGDDLPRRR
jgi:DNA-directed RNA polymerase subunit F